MASIREKPMMAALIIGGAAVLLVGAIVVFGSGGGGDSKGPPPTKQAQGPDLPVANGGILLTPQASPTAEPTQPPAATPTPSAPTPTPEPPTPQPVQVTPVPIQATPVPPTPVPPSPTPQPPPPTPTSGLPPLNPNVLLTPQNPSPTPQPAGPTPVPVPAAKLSDKGVTITFNPGGQGSVHHLNEQLTLTYRGPANSAVAVYDVAAPNTKIFQGTATGSEIGIPVVISGAPNRALTMRIDLFNSGQLVDYATVSIWVTN